VPRKKLSLAHEVEYLSILDDDGQLDQELEPKLPKELLLKMHRAMLLGRRADCRTKSAAPGRSDRSRSIFVL